MLIFIFLGLVVVLAFVTIFFVHHRKAQEEKRIQFERLVRELEQQAKRVEPLLTRLRPHLLPYDLRAALAERWIRILHNRRDLGDKSEAFQAHLQEAEQLVSEIKSTSQPQVQRIADNKQGQEALNLLKNVQYLIMKEYREGKLSEAKGQEYLTSLRHAATQVVVEMNLSQAEQQLEAKKYRAAMIYYQNILKELKKYRGTDQSEFRDVYNDVRATLDRIKPLAQQELNQGPNLLADGMQAEEEEDAFQSDIQRAVIAGKERARQSRG
ncbi:hypothetical protein V6U78_09605 [Marinospirillum sp. MEB164]|uniref:Uncharacterized protein n=1 Tax=Marinospirillum alkalitolerans TaxID=3123374 RepID=A0ABW8PYA9_9GAMM